MEGVADIINIFEEIHMVFFYVQDNSNLWKEMQKAISVFAGFCDKYIRASHTDIAADCL